MSYMRPVIGRATKTTEFIHKVTKRTFNHATTVRRDVTVRTNFGFRLACGHAVRGEHGVGKLQVKCYYCEWDVVGYNHKFENEGWIDVPDET